MLLHNKTVAIIGGGPVGLTLARLLQQACVAVTVYERDENPNARIWGGTLDLHQGSGQAAMQKAGLLEKYYATALPMGVTMVDEQGRVLFTKKTTPKNRYDNPEINRNELRQLLLNSLTSNTVVWDSKCTGVDVHNGKWRLSFDNKPATSADVVIGANGGRSKVRQYVTDVVPHETGTLIIQGDVSQPENRCPAFYNLCGGNRLMASFDQTLLVANPFNNGALTYGVMFKQPEGWAQGYQINYQDTEGVAEMLSARFAGWDVRYRQLFASTVQFVSLPARILPLTTPWKQHRPLPITLIGDAAHLMPPFAGQGVNTGLVDAMILADNLTGNKFITTEAAIADYEQQMFRYAAEAQSASLENEIKMLSPGFSFRQFIG